MSNFTFTKEQVQEIYLDHALMAQDFLSAIEKNSVSAGTDEAVSFSINRRRLYLAIESAYQDIARYKNYHQDEPIKGKLDATKRGAYLIKWVNKFKPIDAKVGKEFEPNLEIEGFDIFENINEYLALYFCENHLSYEVGIDLAFSQDKIHEFIYYLLYRELNEHSWIAILQLLKDSCKCIDQVDFLRKI